MVNYDDFFSIFNAGFKFDWKGRVLLGFFGNCHIEVGGSSLTRGIIFFPSKLNQNYVHSNCSCTKSLLKFFGNPHLRGSKIGLKTDKMVHFMIFSKSLNGTKYVPYTILHIPKVYWIFLGTLTQGVQKFTQKCPEMSNFQDFQTLQIRPTLCLK